MFQSSLSCDAQQWLWFADPSTDFITRFSYSDDELGSTRLVDQINPFTLSIALVLTYWLSAPHYDNFFSFLLMPSLFLVHCADQFL